MTVIKQTLNEIFEVNRQIEDSIALKIDLLKQVEKMIIVASVCVTSLNNGGKIIFMGNGGSAADAQHFAAELTGKYYLDREPLYAVALTTNTSIITALGNDFGYDTVFSRQIKAIAYPGDVVFGISTSGNSHNIIQGLDAAKKMGAITVALTGAEGKLHHVADYVLAISSTNTPRIQEGHVLVGHIICYLVEHSIFGEG